MTSSSLSLRPGHAGSSLQHGLHNSQLLCQAQCSRRAGAVSHITARYPRRTQTFAALTIIRSVAGDSANLRTSHTKVNNLESSPSGFHTRPTTPLDPLASQPADLSLLPPYLHRAHENYQEVPIDVLGKGRFVKNKPIYRQIFVIRSYEVGFDKTASIDTITKLFQETSLNHVGMLDFVGDGMGTTHAMMSKRLIWVVTRMHIEMARYPAWGDVVQIDSWVSSSGKNGMRRDFLVQDYATGSILGRATSNWALMNQDTRKLSRMPEDVRAEISTQFVDSFVIDKDGKAFERIPLLNDSAPFKSASLAPKIYDMDMNQHVNNVKYIHWVLESLPRSLLMSCKLSKVTLEYRRECGSSDMLESLAQSDMTTNLDNPWQKQDEDAPLGFTHLLRLSGNNFEVLRARTQWRVKQH